MKKQTESVDAVIAAAIDEIVAATRRVAAQALDEALGSARTVSKPAPRRPSGGGGLRQRRSDGELAVLTQGLVEQIRSSPGQRIGELAASLGCEVADLSVPKSRLLAAGKIKRLGQTRHARYFPLWGNGHDHGSPLDGASLGDDEAR